MDIGYRCISRRLYSSDFKFPSVRILPGVLELNFGAKLDSQLFHHVWLRDNCQCPKCLHPTTKQKLVSSAQIPLDIKPDFVNISNRELEIVWSKSPLGVNEEPHKSIYDLSWLKSNSYTPENIKDKRRLDHPVRTWDVNEIKSVHLWKTFDEIMNKTQGERHLWEFISNLQTYGLGFIRNVPDRLTIVEEIAERFGPIRETFYGRSWDVKSTVDAKNIAYTSLFLDLHMDLMYFESPPGIQFLHVIQSSLQGGDSIFTDSFKAVEILRKDHPHDFDILSKVPVTFHYNNNGHHLRFVRPTLVVDDPNHQLQVNYAPPFQAPLEAPYEHVEEFYSAFKIFDQILHENSMTFRRKLESGDCVVFQNRRVLHGRLSFDARSGTRHLRGTYVDWDSMMDRYRVLKNIYDLK